MGSSAAAKEKGESRGGGGVRLPVKREVESD